MPKDTNQKIKRLITALLAFLLKAVEIFFKSLGILILFIGKILSPVGHVFFKYFFLPIYGRYLIIKNRASKRAKNFLEKLLLAIANKYSIYFVIFFIVVAVLVGNVNPISKEDAGQNALIYKIIGIQNIQFIEDTYSPADESKVLSYLGENSQIESNLFTESQRQEEELYNENSHEELGMYSDGSSLSKPDLIDTNTAKIGSKSIREYLVSSGDSIGKIAMKFDISINTILWANNLAATSYIKEGQKLIIPPVSGVLHKIVKGDTIAKIAQKYSASADSITSFNNLSEKGLIAGQTIMVPGGRVIYTTKPRSTVVSSGRTGTQTYNADDSNIVSSGGRMVWPSACQRISQYYRGWLHTGVDIACPIRTSVKAADSGVVTRVQYGKTGYGYNVMISHGGGKVTLYGHLSRIDVVAGQKVGKGEQIGLEGSTGRSTGPHLHFEVRINGGFVNPLSYIR